MAATRKQKQTQKLQEQAMSKALAETKPTTSHVSFDDDDDDDMVDNIAQEETLSQSNVEASHGNLSEEDSDDDDAPIEVVSNKTSRKQASQVSAKLKAQEKAYV